MSDIRFPTKHNPFPSRIEEVQLPIEYFSEKSGRIANSTGASVKNGAENRIGEIVLALAPGVVDVVHVDGGGGSVHTGTTHAS